MSSDEITMSSAEATWGMIILFTILIIVVFFFCCVPVYKALQARYLHWEDPENDPRWNVDQFQFSPTSPRLGEKTNKYNRLSMCSHQTVSRGSSFRNTCMLPRMEDQVEIKMPPKYADIFNPEDSSLGTPPAYYSHSPSDTEDSDKMDQLKKKPNQTSTAANATEQPAVSPTVQSADFPTGQDFPIAPPTVENAANPSADPNNPVPPAKTRKTYRKIKKENNK